MTDGKRVPALRSDLFTLTKNIPVLHFQRHVPVYFCGPDGQFLRTLWTILHYSTILLFFYSGTGTGDL